MSLTLLSERPHRRWNPLRGDWVLVCPHRALRPWSGQTEKKAKRDNHVNNDKNPLRPGAQRANGMQNPEYISTFVFTNDFPALLDAAPAPDAAAASDTAAASASDPSELFCASEARGTCRVMCFHPDPRMTLALMSVFNVELVVNEWIEQSSELGSKYTWVQIFENRGEMMGCSNPHPHCQIWASDFMPNEVLIKDGRLRQYKVDKGLNMLLEYGRLEMEKKERVVAFNDHWMAVVPFWATWPFETLLMPYKRHVARLTDLEDVEKTALAHMLNVVTIKYDNIFESDFPYTMGIHGAPTGSLMQQEVGHWQIHLMFLPPLLRSATVKKFMVGYEMLANVQRDITPEVAADIIRKQSNVHYTRKEKDVNQEL